MAVKLSPADVAKLGPAAKSQIHAVPPDERPAAQPKRRRRTAEQIRIDRARAAREEQRAFALGEDRRRRAGEREQRRQTTVKRKLAAQQERQQRDRTAAREARMRTVRTGAVRFGRGTARSAGQIRGNVSIDGLFGIITGAAVVGALLFRANTITPLLGQMVTRWQQVIALGKGK